MGVVVPVFNPSIWEAETGGFVSSRSAKGCLKKQNKHWKPGGRGGDERNLELVAPAEALLGDINSVTKRPVVEGETQLSICL